MIASVDTPLTIPHLLIPLTSFFGVLLFKIICMRSMILANHVENVMTLCFFSAWGHDTASIIVADVQVVLVSMTV